LWRLGSQVQADRNHQHMQELMEMELSSIAAHIQKQGDNSLQDRFQDTSRAMTVPGDTRMAQARPACHSQDKWAHLKLQRLVFLAEAEMTWSLR